MPVLNVGNEEQAEIVAAKLRKIFSELEDLGRSVNEQVDSEQSRTFRQAIGAVCGTMVMDVMGPLYRAYPQIRPDTWPKEQ